MVEIIMPVYNATGAFLQRAIKSVIAQTYNDWRLWIVDDFSTESTTKSILDLYEFINHPLITIIRKNSNSGPSTARNTALALIELDSLVAYCDADDQWNPEHLTACVAAIERENYDLVYSNPKLIDEDNNIMYANFNLYNEFNWTNLQRGNFIFTPTVVHRNGLGFFDPTLDGLEDYDYWIRSVKAQYKISQLNGHTCVCTVRAKGNNMSSKGQAVLSKIKEKHKDFFEFRNLL